MTSFGPTTSALTSGRTFPQNEQQRPSLASANRNPELDGAPPAISVPVEAHKSQMKTPGPPISFETCFCSRPQKEQTTG